VSAQGDPVPCLPRVSAALTLLSDADVATLVVEHPHSTANL
jgi:hypothetical protein